MNRAASSRTQEKKNMPFPKPAQKPAPNQKQPPPKSAYNPVLKQRHVDRVLEMAEESGRDPNELMHEALDHVFGFTDAPPMPEHAAPPATSAAPPPNGATTRANESPLPRRARHDAINAAAGREDGDPESALAALERREATAEAEGDGDNAPEHMMKSDKPNPLRRPTSKDWAGIKDVEDKPGFLNQKKSDDEPKDDEGRKAALRSKYLAPRGRVQQRG